MNSTTSSFLNIDTVRSLANGIIKNESRAGLHKAANDALAAITAFESTNQYNARNAARVDVIRCRDIMTEALSAHYRRSNSLAADCQTDKDNTRAL